MSYQLLEHIVIVTLMVLWIAMIPSEVFRNYWIIEIDGERPNYFFSFILRGFVSLIHGVIFNPQNWVDYIPVLTFQCTSFFIIFSPFLNNRRGKGFFYIGKESGIVDMLTYQRPWLYRLIYYISCILFLISIIVLYNRPLLWYRY